MAKLRSAPIEPGKRHSTAHRGIYYRYLANGKKTYDLRPKGTWQNVGPRLDDALRIQAQVRLNRVEGQLGITRINPVRFDALAGEYLELFHSKSKPRNWPRVHSIFRQLVGFFGPRYTTEITPRAIKDYKLKRQTANLAPISINVELDYLKAALNCAVQWNYLARIPRIEMYKVAGRGNRRFMAATEIDYILDNSGPDHYDAILLALDTGMRPIELWALRKENWKPEEHLLHLTDTKNGNPRDVPLTARGEKIIAKRFNKSDRLFPNFKTEAAMLSRFCRERRLLHVNIPPWTFYDLRHTWSTRLHQLGVDPYTVGELAGQSSPDITMGYVWTTLERKRDAIGALAGNKVCQQRIRRHPSKC